MDRTYTKDQLTEIEKVLKYIRQMESIVRTSPSAEQKERVRKELKKYTDRLVQLVPGVNPQRINVETLLHELGIAGGVQDAPDEPPGEGEGFGRVPVQKASAHSTDPDVNLLSTILTLLHREYWPAIADQHCKLDFSNGAERDAIRTILENVMRNLRVLAETIEEYAQAEKQDFREQLMKMKNKQTRVFLFESNEFLKKMRDFLKKLIVDLTEGGGSVLNKDDLLKFNPRFEEATMLEGRTVADGIQEFEKFVSQAIGRLNMPEFKQRSTSP
ncbi:MAG: hypothetical protein HY042_08270 [Spirochaetia bacterium]|nr:hypothetical protein [Spirochaetia bacterium]